MKRIFFSFVILTSTFFYVFAGGLVTNSNQSASYFRMLARGASTSGDAVYYNPAGLAFLDDGFTISLNTQMIWMQRTLNNNLATLNNPEFIGKLYVPVFPGVYAAYKTGNWTFSLGFNPPAGGGSIKFDKGLPMLEKDVSMIPPSLSAPQPQGLGIPTKNYSMESMMDGSSIVYGVQAGATYRIGEKFSVFGGVRMMFASNSYKGHVKDIMINPQHPQINPSGGLMSAPTFFTTMATGLNAQAAQADAAAAQAEANNMPDVAAEYRAAAAAARGAAAAMSANAAATGNQELDVTQKGKGFAPILGIHFQHHSFNLAAKYEFATKITIENDTKANAMNMYPNMDKPGGKLRSDVPAVLSLAGSYNILTPLKLSVTYIHHFEKQAFFESWVATPTPANPLDGYIVRRQDLIDSNTNEFMLGLEWNATSKLTLSMGGQYTNFGVKETWQNDITHHLDNFTLGLGVAYHFNDKLTLNIGGLNTWYSPVSIEYNAPVKHTQKYDRSNIAIAIGLDFNFGKKK